MMSAIIIITIIIKVVDCAKNHYKNKWITSTTRFKFVAEVTPGTLRALDVPPKVGMSLRKIEISSLGASWSPCEPALSSSQHRAPSSAQSSP